MGGWETTVSWETVVSCEKLGDYVLLLEVGTLEYPVGGWETYSLPWTVRRL